MKQKNRSTSLLEAVIFALAHSSQSRLGEEGIFRNLAVEKWYHDGCALDTSLSRFSMVLRISSKSSAIPAFGFSS